MMILDSGLLFLGHPVYIPTCRAIRLQAVSCLFLRISWG